MSVIIRAIGLTVFLVSCASTPDPRYRDTQNLERPPTLVSSNASKEPRVVDNSSIPKKKDHTGLGSNVYLSTATQLNIKQPFSEAWNTLNRALKQSGLKITDHERDKGLYYVSQDTGDKTGFFAKMTSFLCHDAAIYVLTVKQEGEETTVIATTANATEQSSADKNGTVQPSTEGASDLLQVLFKTLRDDLKEE